MTNKCGIYSFPFLCLGCRVDRHELCSAPDQVYCECDCAKDRTPPPVIRTPDITHKTYDREGREIDCAPTLQQYRRAVEADVNQIHFVGFGPTTAGAWDE